jgi:hypothetical protein
MTIDRQGTWIEVEGKGPAWARRAFVDDDGTVYLPGLLGGSEREAILCAGFDGVSVITDKKHFYLPADWLRREFPANEELITRAERRCIQAMCPASPYEAEQGLRK